MDWRIGLVRPELTSSNQRKALDTLWRAFIRDGADYIEIDGHTFRNEFLRTVTQISVDAGWLDLGELIEGDQWSWYEARLTPEGRQILTHWRGK